MMGMFFFLTQFLQNVLHYGPLACGFAFVPLPTSLFITSQINARVLSERFSARNLILVGLTLSTTGVALLTQLSATSSYLNVLGSLLLFGIGNGIAFIPLTTVSLSGVQMADAGAASGLVNVMQQLGGSVGLAVLVTVFGSVSRNALAHPPAGMTSSDAAQHAFVLGSERGFLTATLFLGAALLLVAVAIRPSSPQDELDEIEEELMTADLVAAE
jgi:fucose permease